MAFHSFEASRGACGTLKYRCPAAPFGLECEGVGLEAMLANGTISEVSCDG